MSSDDDDATDDDDVARATAQPKDETSTERLLVDVSATAASVSLHPDVLRPIDGRSTSISASLTGGRSSSQGKPVVDEALANLTDDDLDRHAQRRADLESALDALLNIQIAPVGGDAPFRFHQSSATLPSPAPEGTALKEEAHGPQLSEYAKKKTMHSATIEEDEDSDDDDEEHTRQREPDPLYDDDMDDADEKWVQTNLRARQREGERGKEGETDATLCCPCCFVTVCMDCQRHARYPNQYRAQVAMNCRVKTDEILTYGSEGETSERGRAPQIGDHRRLSRMERGHAQPNQRLQRDEYFGVVCSDCGTTVGVYDHQQFYHFFNVLPSHC
ncbi:hypothetical protein PINS_up005305 [Pythium insidiosum]|nr:hypothetical protein PINS_up005305 [Pythium insidiosum]